MKLFLIFLVLANKILDLAVGCLLLKVQVFLKMEILTIQIIIDLAYNA